MINASCAMLAELRQVFIFMVSIPGNELQSLHMYDVPVTIPLIDLAKEEYPFG